MITNDGSSSRDITSRIAKAASVMGRLSNPLFRKHRISIRTKINMDRALVVSVLLYGSEAWATTLADRRRLDVFDEESFTSTLTSMVGKYQEAAPQLYGVIQSSTTSTLLASTPSMLPRWYLTDPSGRHFFAEYQRSNPSKVLKSSKSYC